MPSSANLEADFLYKHPQLIEVLAEWHHSEWGGVRGEQLTESVNLLSMAKSADELPLVLVAFDNGKPVGMGWLIAHDIESRRDLTPWLAALYVVPIERNKGIGSFLVSKIVAEAGRLGFKRAFLFTNDKIALYSDLGWRLAELFPYRSSTVAIMVTSVDEGVVKDDKSTLAYIVHLHNYIYGLKKEAEERGKSILTAAALYTASLVWFIKFATDVTRDSVLTKILTSITITSGGVGFLFVIWSLWYALKTFAPQVVDANSPMEPFEIVSKSIGEFERECESLTEDAAKRALAREIRAVSQLQIRRSDFVSKSSRRFAVGLLFLIFCVFSILGIYLMRWSYEFDAEWPARLGKFIATIATRGADLPTGSLSPNHP